MKKFLMIGSIILICNSSVLANWTFYDKKGEKIVIDKKKGLFISKKSGDTLITYYCSISNIDENKLTILGQYEERSFQTKTKKYQALRLFRFRPRELQIEKKEIKEIWFDEEIVRDTKWNRLGVIGWICSPLLGINDQGFDWLPVTIGVGISSVIYFHKFKKEDEVRVSLYFFSREEKKSWFSIGGN